MYCRMPQIPGSDKWHTGSTTYRLSNAIVSNALTIQSQFTGRNNVKPQDRVMTSAEWTQLFYSVMTMVHGLNVILVSV